MAPLHEDHNAGGRPLYQLRVVLPSRDRLLADLTATLAELDLDVLDGEITTDDKGRAVDTLRIRGPTVTTLADGAPVPSEAERAGTLGDRVRARLQEVLSTTRLRPGELTNGTVALREASEFNFAWSGKMGSRQASYTSTQDKYAHSGSESGSADGGVGSRRDSVTEGAGTPALPQNVVVSMGEMSGGGAVALESPGEGWIEPLVAWVDMRALSVLLALEDSPLGQGWRAYLRCHYPQLLPMLVPEDKGPTDAKGIGPFVTAEGASTLPSLRAALAHIGAPSRVHANAGAAAAAPSPASMLGVSATAWSDALTAFLLHDLRESDGRGDEGLLLAQLQRGPELGAGACGIVYLARDVLSDRVYAIKSFSLPDDADRQKTVLRYLERERDILRLLADSDRSDTSARRWFVHLVCAGSEASVMQLVMPACLGGELWNLLNEFGQMSEAEAQFYTACLVLALQRLHALGVVYRDLKPENVLLRDDGWPMIADFGLASFHVGEKPLYSLCGTPEFMAPEVIGGTGAAGYGYAADWWSLGILLCQCLTLSTPFVDPQQRARRTFDNVLRGRLTVPPELHHSRLTSRHAAAIIDAMLTADVGRRLGSAARGEIRAHPFFWGLDWEALERREIEPPHVHYARQRADEAKRVFHRQPEPVEPVRKLGFAPDAVP